jgi:hypothetical protein
MEIDEIDELAQRMEAAIRKLPILPGQQRYVRRAAELLVISPSFAKNSPKSPPRGDKAAIRELDELASLMADSIDCCRNLSSEALRALSEELPGPEIKFDLGSYPIQSIFAGLREQALLAKAQLEAKPVKKGSGRPPNAIARGVTDIALSCYEAMTGKRAGVSTDPWTQQRGGPFLRFLRDVFDVLGIKDSVVSQAKTVVKERSMHGGMFNVTLKIVCGEL